MLSLSEREMIEFWNKEDPTFSERAAGFFESDVMTSHSTPPSR
jgi:hypothetical protein